MISYLDSIFDFLFEQYTSYEPVHIVLEITAVSFGLFSVWFSKQNNIWVFPTGMVSTALYVYLLFQWGLLGDMLINAYYFLMSIYGWYVWSRKADIDVFTPITRATPAQHWWSFVIFITTLIFVFVVYQYFNKWIGWAAYADTFTTGLFFVAMWLMAKRKVENWVYWIVGDIVSVPLYFHKGFTFSSLQYLIFTVIAFYGYRSWNISLNRDPRTLSR